MNWAKLTPILFALLPIGITGCGMMNSQPAMIVIEGEIDFKDPVKLPSDIQVTVIFEDISNVGKTSDIISIVEFYPEGKPPYPFKLSYDKEWIRPYGNYAIRARIDVDDVLTYMSTESVEPLTKVKSGASPLRIIVEPVAE